MAQNASKQPANNAKNDPKKGSSKASQAVGKAKDKLNSVTSEDITKAVGKGAAAVGTVMDVNSKLVSGRAGNASIAGMAKKNMFEFPVFVSSSVPLDYATATNSLLEQVYASYLQMAISMNPVIDKQSALSGTQFKQYKTDTGRYVEYTDMTYAHDVCHNVIEEDNVYAEFDLLSIEDSDAKVILESVDYQPLSEFDHYFMEDGNSKPNDKNNKKPLSEMTKEELDEERLRQDVAAKIEDRKRKKEQDDKNKEQEKQGRDQDKRDFESFSKETAPKPPTFIDESKIKKLNTMKPLMMSVELRVMADNGTMEHINYIVGVKTYSRLVDADILPEVAEFPIKEMNKLTRKAKWRAGEIKFLDYLFNFKEKKQTAVDSKDPKRKWFRRLYQLAHMKGDAMAADIATGSTPSGSAISRASGSKAVRDEGLIPNATLVISKSDVDNIKDQTKIDLLKPSTAKGLCNELFLMSIVVIDTDADSIKTLIPDLHNDYEVHSLASVNKQLAELDTAGTKTRDMFKLLGK